MVEYLLQASWLIGRPHPRSSGNLWIGEIREGCDADEGTIWKGIGSGDRANQCGDRCRPAQPYHPDTPPSHHLNASK